LETSAFSAALARSRSQQARQRFQRRYFLDSEMPFLRQEKPYHAQRAADAGQRQVKSTGARHRIGIISGAALVAETPLQHGQFFDVIAFRKRAHGRA
jgi:hypothetical protein